MVGSTEPGRSQPVREVAAPRIGRRGPVRTGNSETALRLRTRLLLIAELLLGLAPITCLYVYHFPVGVFWTRRVLELAGEGIGNAYTSGVAVAFIAGGVGLLGLWIAILGRLMGRAVRGGLVRVGVATAVVVAVASMIFVVLSGAWWPEYYLFGAPLLVAVHQILALARSPRPQLASATAQRRALE